MRTLSVLFIAASIAVPAFSAGMTEHVFINKNEIKWGAAPPAMPKGAKVAVLFGDPDKPGPFTMRLSAPAGYKIPPHWHSMAENLTIISGALYLGFSEKYEPASAKALKEGGFHFLPAKARHFALAKTPTVVQISGEGPFDINYLDPADDPRTMPAKR